MASLWSAACANLSWPMAKLMRRCPSAPNTSPGTTATCAWSSKPGRQFGGGRRAAVAEQLADVREGEHPAGRCEAHDPRDVLQSVDEQVARYSVARQCVDGGRYFERGQRRALGQGGDVGDGGGHLASGCVDQSVGPDEPTNIQPVIACTFDTPSTTIRRVESVTTSVAERCGES